MGGYGPVVKEELYGEHTCLATGGKRAQFQLTFTADHFQMKGAGGPIPAEVLATVLGAGKKAEKIEGRWDLAAGKLTLTEIRADGRPGSQEVVLRPFRTGPNSRWFTRFDVGGTQYHLRPNEETNPGGGERTGSIFSNTPFSETIVIEKPRDRRVRPRDFPAC
jgi:hypothetical protein